MNKIPNRQAICEALMERARSEERRVGKECAA